MAYQYGQDEESSLCFSGRNKPSVAFGGIQYVFVYLSVLAVREVFLVFSNYLLKVIML